MTDFPEIEARLIAAARSLVFSCPWCRRQHWHGAGDDPAHPLYGHRVSHCDGPGAPTGYVLVPEGSALRIIGPTTPPLVERRAGGEEGRRRAATGGFHTVGRNRTHEVARGATRREGAATSGPPSGEETRP